MYIVALYHNDDWYLVFDADVVLRYCAKELRHRFQIFLVEREENEMLPEAYDSALEENSDEDLRDKIRASVYQV